MNNWICSKKECSTDHGVGLRGKTNRLCRVCGSPLKTISLETYLERQRFKQAKEKEAVVELIAEAIPLIPEVIARVTAESKPVIKRPVIKKRKKA